MRLAFEHIGDPQKKGPYPVLFPERMPVQYIAEHSLFHTQPQELKIRVLADQKFDVKDLKESDINEFMDELKFAPEQKERARKIVGSYRGRQIDALSVLGYAKEQGDKMFDSFAGKLEEREKDFETIHPDLRYARTDIMAFFLGLLADLGKAPVKEAEAMEKLVKDYGPGIIVLPKK